MERVMYYVVHKGDELVTIGTMEEVMSFLGVERKTVQFLSSPSNQKRWANAKGKRLVIDRVEV